MKILQINKYFFLKGGADAVMFNLTELLEKHGHQVIPFCTIQKQNKATPYQQYFVDAPEIRQLKGICKLKGIKYFFWNKKAANQLEKLIQTEKPDIAHLHNIFNGLSLSILPILKKHNIPVVITMHDTRWICPTSYFNLRGSACTHCLKWGSLNCGIKRCFQDNFFFSWILSGEMLIKEKIFDYNKYIDRYLFVSHAFLKFHQERHTFFQEKGVVLYNFNPQLHTTKPNFHKGTYLLYLGRITPEKGVETLMKAMKNHPNTELHIVGDGPLKEQLQAESSPNIKFLGFLSGTSLQKEVENASFVIVPSECEENNPLTIIEAYSYGKPVIGSNIGGIPEIVKEGETGLLFSAFDYNALSESIQKASMLSQEEYTKMAIQARHFADTHFEGDYYYNQLLSIYEQLIKEYENI